MVAPAASRASRRSSRPPAQIREEFSRIPVHTDRQLRELIANYYGMISLIDHNVGAILLELESLGLLGNTLVVYSTDHGDWLGDRGLILKGRWPTRDCSGRTDFSRSRNSKGRWSTIRYRPSICRRLSPITRGFRSMRSTAAAFAHSSTEPKHATSPTANGICGRRARAELDLRTVRTAAQAHHGMRSGGELRPRRRSHEMENI